LSSKLNSIDFGVFYLRGNRRTSTVIWQYSKSRIPETLTIGYFYYRKDLRIRVVTNTTYESDQSWNLEIRKVKLEDEGYYLCKVMSEPDSQKRTIFLKVEVDLKLTPANPVVCKLYLCSSSLVI